LLPGLSIGLSALLALAAPPPAAGGDGVAIRVDFDAPTGCSSADAFYAGLLARMKGARRAAPSEDAVHLGVKLTRVGNKVRGELRLMDGPGDGDTRRVVGETCDAVVEVLSLTTALALTAQPARATPPPPPSPPPRSPPPSPPPRSPPPSPPPKSPPQETPAKPPETAPPPDAPKPPEEPKPPEIEKPPVIEVKPPPPPPALRPTHVDLGLHAVAADVISTSVSFGGALAARLERHSDDGAGASIGLAFLYVSNDLLQTADAVAVRWTAAAVTACPGWNLGRVVTVQPCAQVIGGWLAASGRGLTNPNSVGRSWWSAGAILRAGAHLGAGFSLELEAGVAFPLIGREFTTRTPERTVGETPTVAPMVALGLSRSL